MANIKRSLSIAIAINFSISLIEATTGFIAHSNSLTMDCIHNFSDVLALIFLRLWCTVSITGSRNFERLANLFNSLGIICVCSFGIWQSIDRTLQPKASTAIVSLVTGLLVLLGNGLAAKVLYHIK